MPTELIHEHRATRHPASIRTETRDGKEVKCVEGYGAVFYDPNDPGTEYSMWSDLKERIDAGAFNRTIAEQCACRSYVNHNPDNMLGRCDKGTMRLKVDGRGCFYSTDLPDTQCGRDTEENLRNGNLDGSSFAFEIRAQRWEDTKQDDGSIMTIRTITDCELYEMGPVNMPAYESTTAGLRATERREDAKAQRDAWRADLKRRAEAEAEALKIRSLERKRA